MPERPTETIPHDEDDQIRKVVRLTAELLRLNNPGRALRGQHAKATGVARATLQINDDLPSDLKKGLFEYVGQKFLVLRQR